MLNFSGKKGNIKLGVEGGYRRNMEPNSSSTVYGTMGNKSFVQFTVNNGNESGMYITPKVEGEFKATKHLSFVADADLKQGNAGIRLTF